MTVRIRQIKPTFWSDAAIARLSEGARLFYIGTWGLADDAGWFDNDVPEIGHALYGYEARPVREKRVRRMLTELVEAERLIDHGCGHLEVPRLHAHQHLPGPTRQVRTTLNEHLQRCSVDARKSPPIPADDGGDARAADPRKSPRSPANPRPGNGKEKEKVEVTGKEKGGVGGKGEDPPPLHGDAASGPPSEFKARLAAVGYEPK